MRIYLFIIVIEQALFSKQAYKFFYNRYNKDTNMNGKSISNWIASKTLITLYALIALAFLLCSCTPQLSVNVKDNMNVDIAFSSALETDVEVQIRKLIGVDSSTALLQQNAIAKSITDLGFATATTKLSSPSAVDIQVQNQKLTDRNSVIEKFLTIEESKTKTILTIDVSPHLIYEIIQGMPQDTQEYVELLMAPAFTGEEMDADEYLNLFALVYGQGLANAFEKSFLRIALRTPDTITSAHVSRKELATVKTDKNTARIDLCLHKILSLQTSPESKPEDMVKIEIEW